MKWIIWVIIGLGMIGMVHATDYMLNLTLMDVEQDSVGPYSIEETYRLRMGPNNILYVAGRQDDEISAWNTTNPSAIAGFASYVDASGAGSIDGIVGFSINVNDKLIYASATNDDYVTIVNITVPTSIVYVNSIVADTGDRSSYDAIQIAQYCRKNGEVYLYADSSTDTALTAINVTRPQSAMTNFSSEGNSDRPFSKDGLRYAILDDARNLVITSSDNDDEVSIYNCSGPQTPTSLPKLGNYNRSSGAGSVDGAFGLDYDNSTGLLYVASGIDHGFSILNITDPSNIVLVGSLYDVDLLNQSAGIKHIKRENLDVVIITSASVSRRIGITIVNTTDKTNPIVIQTFNTSSGTCNYYEIRDITASDDGQYLFFASAKSFCLYSVKLYDAIPTESPLGPCDYSGSGNFTIQNAVCNITSNITVQGGFNFNIYNSTIYMIQSWVKNYTWAHWMSGWLHII